MISIKELKHLAELSALELKESELEDMKKDFGEIMKFVDQVKEAEIEEGSSYEDICELDELREDKVEPSMEREKILKNAPERDESTFLVPKVVD